MKARVESNWINNAVKVWFYEQAPDGTTRVVQSEGAGVWRNEIVEHGAVLPSPTLELPHDWLTALLREASGVVPAEDATTRHLTDAIGVRDRLLAMVEKKR